MTEREYAEYIEECNKSIDDFNRIAKRLGVDPTGMPINMAFVLKLLRAIEKVLDSQPCEDAISRQAVLDELNKWDWQELYLPIHFKENIVDVLPPVIPTRPKGKWEWVQYDSNPNIGNWHCSECGRIIRCTESQLVNYPYCHCGADMREGET